MLDGDVPTLEQKVGVIEDRCETVGRDPDGIEHSRDGHVICTREDTNASGYST